MNTVLTNFNFTFVRSEVLPFYGNTHTTTSVTSLQTTLFRHEARDIFRNATNAAEEDAVIFTGSGTTAAVHKLITALNINEVIKNLQSQPIKSIICLCKLSVLTQAPTRNAP